MSFRSLVIAGCAVIAAPVLAAGPLAISTRMLVEQRVAAPDGTVRMRLVTPTKVVPGDHVTVVLAWRNTGAQPLASLVLANPVPHGMAYRGPAPGSPAPELSTDGITFASLDRLRVTTPAGTRPAAPNDVTQVRWRLPTPAAAGSGGELAFQAVLK